MAPPFTVANVRHRHFCFCIPNRYMVMCLAILGAAGYALMGIESTIRLFSEATVNGWQIWVNVASIVLWFSLVVICMFGFAGAMSQKFLWVDWFSDLLWYPFSERRLTTPWSSISLALKKLAEERPDIEVTPDTLGSIGQAAQCWAIAILVQLALVLVVGHYLDELADRQAAAAYGVDIESGTAPYRFVDVNEEPVSMQKSTRRPAATSEWTLDYPPFFAYFERLLSAFAYVVDPAIVKLDNLGYAAGTAVAFQRSTVIVSELVLLLALFRPDRSTAFVVAASVVLHPGLLIVDHIHFQYNGFLLGILLWSLIEARDNHLYACAALFATLLNFKHIFVYLALPYFVFLLRQHCYPPGGNLVARGWPIATEALTSSSRGLIGATTFGVLPNVTPRHCFAITFGITAIFLVKLWFDPSYKRFLDSVVLAAMTSFLFGWHVHEKAVLLFLIPLTLTATDDDNHFRAFVIATTAGVFGLFPLLIKPAETPIKLTYSLVWAVVVLPQLRRVVYRPLPNLFSVLIDKAETLYLLGFVAVQICESHFFIVPQLQTCSPASLLNGSCTEPAAVAQAMTVSETSMEFLPLLLTSVYCAVGIVWSWLRLSWGFLTS
ncbi:hypothetical protein Rhopal_003878-T1 [Rhodotorula paludigena]|uniref:Alpha-1,3-glucosyltransferase n=1 Tax=Rhodotorula paludigena TaxID=86838 RepID=A0AAV5GK58_9BASI|nr:hypothetical protein Rhopal_003878-T1 [Rhodotorula paludigena]